MQYQEVAGGICAPKGFAAAGVHCGIRANHAEKYDLALIKADVRCAAAGVYTTNKVCGAPIKVDRAHLKDGYAQAIIVNSGNANTCAANGVDLANECCALVAQQLGIAAEDVLPASTGVIGQPMTIDPFARGIPAAAARLQASAEGSSEAAKAIMTTDTYEKEYAIEFELAGKTCRLGAIGKGSGMIAPNMATMLAFYTTDAAVSPELLQKALRAVVPTTYNQMSVDLDTSTNDTLLLLASGLAGNEPVVTEGPEYDKFLAALGAVAEHMCALHASDGEGATHLITCEVTHAPTHDDCPRRGKERCLLQPVQGRRVWPRRQLGPHPVRHRLYAGGFFHRQGQRAHCQQGRRGVCVRKRRLPSVQRGRSLCGSGRARHPGQSRYGHRRSQRQSLGLRSDL